ncbi:MAG: hypothetical protein ACYTAN_07950 [Planctomycetota bacterium]|jgi:tRNA U34 2-thiouridine synthase MnmA/TrmU
MTKAIALLSGGLDSQLAAKLVLDQGIEIEGMHFLSVFNTSPKEGQLPAADRAAANIGVPLHKVDVSEGQIAILKDPPHGLGSAANPCIDCHMMMLRIAAGKMRESGADFLVTGEVLGQRPMSQRRHSLDVIDRETGLGGLILRPLCAKALPPTIPEEKGLVDRGKLEGIRGRTRGRQMQLARKFGITDYPSPAGGCLLTDPGFGLRVKDLLEHGELNLDNARLLKHGRHYRLGPHTKAVVGRDEADNNAIEAIVIEGDLLLVLADIPGPTTVLRGETSEGFVATAGALTARASKAKTAPSARLRVWPAGREAEERIIEVAPATDELAEELTVNPQQGARR